MKNILIVEDEQHLAEGLQLNFTLEGFSTDIANSVRRAQQYIEQRHYDVIILDVTLPDGDGFQLCKYIRNKHIHIPVLMLTARTLPEDKVQGLEAGADDYLTKPFDLNELLARIRSLIRRQQWNKGSNQQQTFAFGEASINFDQHLVLVKSSPVQLTTLELQLLQYFCKNKDRVLSRQELLEKVWNLRDYPNTRTVDNFIMRLRRLFEPTPDKPIYFLSIRGRGYKFTTPSIMTED